VSFIRFFCRLINRCKNAVRQSDTATRCSAGYLHNLLKPFKITEYAASFFHLFIWNLSAMPTIQLAAIRNSTVLVKQDSCNALMQAHIRHFSGRFK